jgi:transcriptional regulator with XRE-family HTH domain
MDADTTKPPTLKSLRESLKLSQEQLGARLALSFRTISDWETGRATPRFDNAIALARELGVSLKTLARSMQMDTTGIPDDEQSKRLPSAEDN